MTAPSRQPVSELAIQLALAQIEPPDFQYAATAQEETFARLLPTHAPEKAYREAGYPCSNNVHKTITLALALAGQPQIVERTSYQRMILEAKYDLRTERIYAEYAAIAFSDPADYLDSDGAVLPVEQIRPRARASIKEMETTRYPNGRITTKLKLHDKGGALDALARIKGLFEKDNAQQARVYIDVKRKAEVQGQSDERGPGTQGPGSTGTDGPVELQLTGPGDQGGEPPGPRSPGTPAATPVPVFRGIRIPQ